ncbi:hypothetical protein [Paraflavitalea speifideaquila]|uniref:hypothetical protein n=1 Tax=Paraflavitalea speifideaquila TaxID=3076558 RepID=UPI0028E23A95|nr:hypothetical protein [Paraflavitalea speifideiaquila]
MGKGKYTFYNCSAAELSGDVFSSLKLTAQQTKQAKEQLAKARKKAQEEMSEDTRIELKLLSIRFRMEDCINNKNFDITQTFGVFLKQYMEVFGAKERNSPDNLA